MLYSASNTDVTLTCGLEVVSNLFVFLCAGYVNDGTAY